PGTAGRWRGRGRPGGSGSAGVDLLLAGSPGVGGPAPAEEVDLDAGGRVAHPGHPAVGQQDLGIAVAAVGSEHVVSSGAPGPLGARSSAGTYEGGLPRSFPTPSGTFFPRS